MTATKRLLLISNSTLHGGKYLDHAEFEIRSFLEGAKRVLFFPYAMHDRNAYAEQARKRFESMGFTLESLHMASWGGPTAAALDKADAFFVGGGNTFRLLDSLQRLDLISAIRRRVAQGKPYIGSSAGSIVACPTLKTTKDMPVVQPPSFDALALVPFQISPHYLDPEPASTHMGETQEERILQYLEENNARVVGLREGSMLRVEGGSVDLKGKFPARMFQKNHKPVESQPGTSLDYLLQ
ncbi:MAG TPA: dipeptidase PepE [Patescibacteria group bacterium]|jgi:dipeptidase E|nr:dipeptidase PepE [Patescibacteria group bacterium]